MIQQNIFPPSGCYRDIAKEISEGLYETVKSFSMGLIISLLPALLLMIELKNLWELGSGGNQELLVTDSKLLTHRILDIHNTLKIILFHCFILQVMKPRPREVN